MRTSFPLLLHGGMESGSGSGGGGSGSGSGHIDQSALLAKDLLAKLLLLRTSSLLAAPSGNGDTAIDDGATGIGGGGSGGGHSSGTTQQQRTDATLCDYLTHLRAGLGQVPPPFPPPFFIHKTSYAILFQVSWSR